MLEASTYMILDPRAGPAAAVTQYDLSIDQARSGLRIALVSNGFYDATPLLNAVGAALKQRLKSPEIALYERRDPSCAATPDLLGQIASASDIAITAMGHCGSCTNSAVRDAAALARLGIPACALVTDKFLQPASFVARAAGMPALPRIRLPHPVAGTGPDRIAEIAEGAVAGIFASWRGKPDAVAA
jgi:hypothetical protein